MPRTWRNALLLLFFGLLLPGAGFGETFTVTKTEDDDGPCTPGDCALREAVLAANALPGKDLILLPAGTYLLTIPGIAENESRTGDLDILDDVVIEGIESGQVIVDGNGLDRVFNIFSSVVNMASLIITGGVGDSGGGIRATLSELTIVDSLISGNRSELVIGGGGLYIALGTTTLINTTVSYNSSDRDGGGIHRNGGLPPDLRADLTLVNSTVSHNQASAGGGIFSEGYGDLTLIHSTIAHNEADFVTGLFFFESPAPIFVNTLVVDNQCGFRSPAPVSQGGNLESPGATCFLEDPTDRMNVPDAGLAPLGHYGGPTPTHALLDASPAIDTANDAECEPIDQRGFPRPQDGDGNGVARCDVGAVEFVPTADSVLPTVIPTLDRAGLAALALLLVLAAHRTLRGVG